MPEHTEGTAMKLVMWLTMAVLFSAAGGCAQEKGASALPATPESRVEQGGIWFQRYCSACHGASAQGDGPVAGELSTPPADLTRIAARSAGRFDSALVAQFIDGRERVAAHGSPEMPVWGRSLDDRLSGGFADETRLAPGTILMIVEYLDSIQRP